MRAKEFIVESVDFEQMQPQNIVAVAQQAFAQLYPGVKLYGRSVVEGVGLTTAKGQQGAASAFAGNDTVRGAFYLTLNAYAEGDSMIVVVEDATAGQYKGAATAIIKSLFEAGERLYKTQQRELVINDNANVEAWSAIADRVGAEMMESQQLEEQEFVAEDLSAGGFRIRVSPHLDNRAEKRGISMPIILGILNRLDRARRHIRELEPNTQFNVFDSHHNIHLGMMRSSFDPNKLLLNTVYHNENYHGRNPVLKVR
jgi:hypothetical protein